MFRQTERIPKEETQNQRKSRFLFIYHQKLKTLLKVQPFPEL